MRVRDIPTTAWIWTATWAVLLAFLLPALVAYGDAAASHRADHILMGLFFLSLPASCRAALPVAILAPLVPYESAPFIVTMVWWFVAGYGQWLVFRRLISWLRRDVFGSD